MSGLQVNKLFCGLSNNLLVCYIGTMAFYPPIVATSSTYAQTQTSCRCCWEGDRACGKLQCVPEGTPRYPLIPLHGTDRIVGKTLCGTRVNTSQPDEYNNIIMLYIADHWEGANILVHFLFKSYGK